MIGKLLDYRYQVIKVLATGGFGENYIARDTKRPGNPICVVKHLKPTSTESKVFETAKRLFQSEAETLEKLGNHDQIPRLLAYFVENQNFYLVQEFIEGHPLTDELVPGERWNEAQVTQMLLSILSILAFVHSEGVIHRDIKPDNIIRRYSDGKLVLVDFGAVKRLRASYGLGSLHNMENPSATVAIGTPGYMPTEQGQGRPRHNSDLYSLGIIAIQALTGVGPMDLPEDPHTGELIWEDSASISPELAEVLNKMVRYHFKERYQSASEALEAMHLFADVEPQQYPQLRPQSNPSHSALNSRVLTIAVAPSHPRQPTQAQPVGHQIPRASKGPDFLQILILLGLVGGAAVATPAIVSNVNNFANDFTGATSGSCAAIVAANSNVRSEPSTITENNIVKTVAKDTRIEVTGKRTKLGWVELKINGDDSGWAHSNVIKNREEWVTCLRDKNIAVKTVEDSGLIATPVQEPPVIKNEEIKPTQNANRDDSVDKAREKYESGDLKGAIAILEALAPNDKRIKEGQEMIDRWQKDWTKAEGFFNDVNTAIAERKWDKVQDYQKNPQNLPDISYWRKKVEPLFQEAVENTKKSLPKLDGEKAELMEKVESAPAEN